tara:strand:- start:37 stop:441 length:405 start_codon:yes stop_codon:yes gene_type:complete
MAFKMKGPMFFRSAMKHYSSHKEYMTHDPSEGPMSDKRHRHPNKPTPNKPAPKMKGDLNKDGNMSDYEQNRQDAIDENMEKEGSGMNYGKKAKTPNMHKIPKPFEGNYGQALHNMDFDSDTSEGKKEHYKRHKH